MFGIKFYSMLLVAALIASGAGTPACDKHAGAVKGAQNGNSASKEQKNRSPESQIKELKVLAQGGMSEVDQPLVIVARDESVYDALKQLVSGLPDMTPEFFRRSAVVAAFAGQKRTGGYSVKIT